MWLLHKQCTKALPGTGEQEWILVGLYPIFSFTAMQLEYKVIRLHRQAIDVNYSYLLEEMSPDEVVPYLVQRRLLSQTQAAEVWEKSSPLDKVHKIVAVLREEDNEVVGMFPTFCAALTSAQQLHISERLLSSEFDIGNIKLIILISMMY